MKTTNTPSRRKMLMLAVAAMSTGIIPTWGHTDDESHGDHDSGDKYRSGSNTTFAPANTGLTGKIVVIGGGMAGVTAAKYLRLWGGSGVNVTLVEPSLAYTSNIMSNLVLTNTRTVSSLAYSYTSIATKYGVVVKQAAVQRINTAAKSISLSDGSTLVYDRLVVAPGVDFMDAYGLTQNDVFEDPELAGHRHALVSRAAQSLDTARMVRYDQRNGYLHITDLVLVASSFFFLTDYVGVLLPFIYLTK